MKNTNEWEWVWYVPIDVGKEEVLSFTKWRPNIQDRLKTWNGDGEARVNPQNGIVKVSQLFIKDFFLFLFLKNNYNMLLTPQLEPFPPRPPSTLCMRRCQFSYKTFGVFMRIIKFNTIMHLNLVEKLNLLHQKELYQILSHILFFNQISIIFKAK